MNNLMRRIMSVAVAAITTTSPILSSYTVYASDITVNDDGTVTQISTSTDSSTSEADETKFLFIKLKAAGGKVVLNEGEDQEQRIRLDKKTDGVEYIDVYDKNDVLISSESTKDNGYTYVYEAKADDAVNVKAKADEGYKVKLYELTDDSSGAEIAEDVGFDAGNKVETFKYPVFMGYDKTVKIGFEKKESAEDIAEDLSVDDDVEENAEAKDEETVGKKEKNRAEADANKSEELRTENAKANKGTEAEMNGDTESEDAEDVKKAKDVDISEKSENSNNIESNDKQNSSEKADAGDDLTVNTDGNKGDNKNADITVNDNNIIKNIEENADEKLEEKSSDRVYISGAFTGLTKRIEAAGSSAGIIRNRIKKFLKIYVGVSMNTEMKDVELHKRYIFLNAYKSVMGAEEREFNDNHADEMLVIDDVNQVGGKETTREILANGDDVNGTGSGTGGETVEQDDFLSNIIEELNNKIGLKLDSKALIPYIKNIKEQLMADEQLKNAARQNEECDFATVYYNKIELIFVEELKNLYGIGDSSEVEGLSKREKEDRIEFARAMMDIEMRRRIFGMYLDEVHQRMRGE